MDAHEIRFVVEVSSRYHRRRASFLSRVSMLFSIAVLAAGTGAFVSLFGQSTAIAKVMTLIVAFIGICQTVMQLDRNAAAHERWLSEWNKLRAEVKTVADPDTETLARWIAAIHRIESECVNQMKALENDCYNRTASAMGLEIAPFRITWLQRRLMQVFSFENASY